MITILCMKCIRIIAFLLLLFVQLESAFAQQPAKVKIIFDTDMDSDCDDIGALAMLHVLADHGEAEILATLVSSRNEWSPACVDAINTFYGRPALPVGCPKQGGANVASKYAKELAHRYPQDIGPADKAADAVKIYRQVLSAAPDDSVIIVTVGYMTNLANLLASPASETEPAGSELVRKKVKRWVCMGGNFIGDPAADDLKLGNNNFTHDKAATYQAIRHWPGAITFVGREIGSVPSGLKVGANLRKLEADHILRVGYGIYFGNESQPNDRHVADQATVLFAVRGLRDYWHEQKPGVMEIEKDMKFKWREDAKGKHTYLLKRKVDGKPNDRAIEQVIEELMMQPPAKKK